MVKVFYSRPTYTKEEIPALRSLTKRAMTLSKSSEAEKVEHMTKLEEYWNHPNNSG